MSLPHLSMRPRTPSRLQLTTMLALTGLLAACSLGAAAPSSRRTTLVTVMSKPAATSALHPFGRLTCVPEHGIRFCQGGQVGSRDLRVPSFDKVPLDADVALPPSGKGPYPLIVMLHGLGGSKTDWEATAANGGINDITFAKAGYAVLMYTARGSATRAGRRPRGRTRPPVPRGGSTSPTSVTRSATRSTSQDFSWTRGSPSRPSRWPGCPTGPARHSSWRC